MDRRDVLAMLGATTMVAATRIRAQRPAMPVVGFLSSYTAAASRQRLPAFHAGLAEAGYADGRNVTIEFRWADGHYDRMEALAADLLRHNPSVLVAAGGAAAALAAKQVTSTVPIVFSVGGDPVKLGLAASLNRPGRNMTGVVILAVELEAKLLSLVHELAPKVTTVVILLNPVNRQFTESYADAARRAEQLFGIRFTLLHASNDEEMDTAFATLTRLRAGAVVIAPDPFFEIRRDHLIELAARYTLPVLYFERDFVFAGGLASYGADLEESARQVGVYVGKILGGARPADMPIVQLTKIELVLNLKTARMLGLTIPQSLLLRADEVIQ